MGRLELVKAGNSIPDSELAPRWVLEKTKDERGHYYAMVIRRFGDITPQEFIKYSQRLATLCDQIYQGTTPRLRVDDRIPVGSTESYFASQGLSTYSIGEDVQVASLAETDFNNLFDNHKTVTLSFRPVNPREDIIYSFAHIEWTCREPKKLGLYAQSEALTKLLYRRMFYVKGAPPDINHRVLLGISDYMKEKNKKW